MYSIQVKFYIGICIIPDQFSLVPICFCSFDLLGADKQAKDFSKVLV